MVVRVFRPQVGIWRGTYSLGGALIHSGPFGRNIHNIWAQF
jgi:hypothetical protein